MIWEGMGFVGACESQLRQTKDKWMKELSHRTCQALAIPFPDTVVPRGLRVPTLQTLPPFQTHFHRSVNLASESGTVYS